MSLLRRAPERVQTIGDILISKIPYVIFDLVKDLVADHIPAMIGTLVGM